VKLKLLVELLRKNLATEKLNNLFKQFKKSRKSISGFFCIFLPYQLHLMFKFNCLFDKDY